MAPSRKPKVKKNEAPPVDKLIKPAIAVALAMIVFQFIRGLGGGIKRVNVMDEAELREVFFGEGGTGKSYAVLCQSEESTAPISSVFQDAFNDPAASKVAEFRVMDCDYILPASEKSVAARFSLDMKKRPTIFLSGTVGAPKQIDDKHLKTGSMLVKFLRGTLEVRAAKIETTADLKTKCLDKEYCGLLLKGTKKAPGAVKDAMGKLLKDFPDIAFASIDSSVLYVLNLEEHLPELNNGQFRFVVFKKISGSLEAGGSRLITSYSALPSNYNVAYAPMNNHIANVVQGAEPATKLSSLPVVKTRTKKLEESERAKRQRKLDQQRRAQEKAEGGGSSSTSDGGSGSDDMRDERRAERERRRKEHNAQNNVKPKTPEEIAEIERRRRARMAEEAAKWNIAPEDAPEEGEPIMEDGEEPEDGGDIMEDAEDEIIEDLDAHDDDEDEEDVIDLD
eukprot:CAMPEP_0172442198 /NCGR_PEP_ID=MMETSP1065-20121228/2669_1 /TAXON_ID=265537 /ORGANISM="Amphiprora paludosa, Strain CCMP125" /LENGTH=449 /DNA_ID=CAMNT_0013191961 /DNA_START=37 /DNA_END=1386 /DNA_ORIENTATION=+